jgi:hypothetical protein
MEFSNRHFRTAATVGALTAALALAAAPAHAYKINDQLELNAKIFAYWSTGDNNDANDGFHVDRTYVEARGHLQDGDTIRFTLDQKVENGGVFVKYAYWEHKTPYGFAVKAGQTHTPMLDFDEEHFWGRRWIAPTFADKTGALTSSDIGVAVTGKAGDMVDYYVMLHNGEGYNKTTDGSGYAVSGRVDVHAAGAHLGLFDQEEKTRSGTKDYDPSRQLVYAFYENDLFRFGGEYLMADDGNAANTTTSLFKDGKGFNLQGQVKLPVGEDTHLFARYDTFDKRDNGTDATFTVVGVDFPVAKGVMIAPNVQITDPGTNTGTSADDTNTVYGIKSQFKF